MVAVLNVSHAIVVIILKIQPLAGFAMKSIVRVVTVLPIAINALNAQLVGI